MTLSVSLGLGLTTLKQGGGVRPPAGFVFLTDIDGAYLVDIDGHYIAEAA